MRDTAHPQTTVDKAKQRKCSYCDEPFEPIGRGRLCPECRIEREIEKEEDREARKS